MIRFRAMTLLELMVALSIVGVVAGLAIPSISELVRRSRARVEVREVRAFLSGAASLARLRRECAEIRVVGASLEISMHPRVATAPEPHHCDFTANSSLPGGSNTRTLRLLWASPTADLQLDSRGSVVTPSDYELALTVKGSSEQHRFRVVAGTGLFRRAPW